MKTKVILRKADSARTVFLGGSSPVRIGLVILLGLQSACVSAKDGVSSLPSPPHSLRVNLGKLAVVTGTNAARFGFDQAKGRTRYASDGAEAGLGEVATMNFGDSPAAIVAVALVPLAAAVGAAHSSLQKMPASELRQSESELVQAAADLSKQTCLHEAFLKVAEENLGRAWPTGGVARTSTNYAGFLREGFDTVLELRVDELHLHKSSVSDASFRLLINGRIRLVRALDGQVAYDEALRFRSRTSLFVDWTANGAEPFRTVARSAYRQMAERVISQVLLETPRKGP